MKNKLYIVFLLAVIPSLASALGLGKLELSSALNEPFDGRIQLLSPTADELDSLKVNLADNEAFARANLDRPFVLSNLKFALRRSVDDGPDYIRVFSTEPIREPFLNFLVEVSWSNGRLYREYTILLDPPLYDPNLRAAEFKQELELDTSPAQTTINEADDHTVIYDEDFDAYDAAQTESAPTPNVNYTGGDYGPTTSSDTLWSIASVMRPDTSVSVNQMMLALLRANPEAFFNQNINGLKRGQILRMPNESEMSALNNAEALAEVQSQYAAWDTIKDNFSTSVNERPELSSVPESVDTDTTTSVIDVVETTEPELKLVAANDTEEATEQAASVDSGTGEDLVLAQESIQALTQENLELKDQLQENEALLDDLKRLLSLKDDELAALQEQMAIPTEAVVEEEFIEEAEPVVEEEIVEEVIEEPVEEEAVVEEELIEEAEPVVEEELVEEVIEEPVEEEAVVEEELIEEAEPVVEEEEIEVIDVEPAPAADGIMGMVNQYLGPVKDILLGNPVIGMAVGGVLLVLIVVMVLLKFRKEPAETVDINAPTEEAFPDFDSGDLGSTGDEVPDSEAVTVLPDTDSEAETHIPDEPVADLDLDEEEEKTQFVGSEEPAAEEEPEEDPLQEVNTYLAFEQFDQAEEFVRNAINDNPDNPEFHTKLLEVFYTSGNKKAYEEAAKVLHEKVGGEGEHWNMATAMWQEMSPNRALFEEGEDEEDSAAETTGGFVDVTADEEAADDDSGGLDFDIGGAEAAEPAADADEDVLDLTANEESAGEDLLDVTAAVGLDASADEVAEASAEDDVLDISGSSADGDGLLDITASDESAGEDLLDATAAIDMDTAADTSAEDDVLDISGSSADGDGLLDITASDESTGEDLLDVTAAANLELDTEEDLLDVTAATSAGADSSELLEIGTESSEADEAAETEGGGDEALDLDVAEPEAADDNVLDFDLAAETPEAEAAAAADEGLELDMSGPEAQDEPIRLDAEEEAKPDADDEISLDFDMGDTGSEDAAGDDMSLDINAAPDSESGEEEISLDLDIGDDNDGIELDLSATDEDDLSIEADASPDLEISLDEEAGEDTIEADAGEMDFDLSLDTDTDTPSDEGIDLDGTVEMPKAAVAELDDDDDEDEEDHTVFVPRAAQPEEQSAEDEVATKLDLAKAYVELGDKESAKTILDEVMVEGNDEQKKQAEDLLGQV